MVLFLSTAAAGEILHVPDNFPTIQSALDAATDGDTVILSDGLYSGIGNKNLSFQGKAILLRSQNGPITCVIDCENDGRAFLFNKGESAASVVDGLTITRGSIFGGGGAIYCYRSSPTISNCVITGNSSSGFGGAIACAYSSFPSIHNCEISGNSSSLGGAIYCSASSSPHISGSTISDNSADSGGAIYSRTAAPSITNSILWNNSAAAGSEIALAVDSTLDVDFCDVEGGEAAVSAEDGSSLIWGANNIDSDPVFVDARQGNYRLGYGSECINSGTTNGSVADGFTDMGVYPAVTADDEPGQNHATIGAALADLAFIDAWGGSVVVFPGRYFEDISIREGIDLIGAGPHQSIIEAPKGISCIGIGSAHISGFMIRDAIDGITIDASSPVISNNVFTGCVNSALTCKASSSPTIRNNTIDKIAGGGIIIGPGASPVMVNNIISNTVRGITATGGDGFRIDYNNLYNVSEPYSGCSAGPHDIAADPMFIDSAANDYRLNKCSFAIDAGDAVEALTMDYLALSLEIYVNEVTNISTGDIIWITDGVNIENATVAGFDADLIYIENGFENSYRAADGAYVASRFSIYSTEPAPDGGRVNMGAYGGAPEAATSESVTDDDGDACSECESDCDDANGQVYPGAQETCNSIDDDCDGLVDLNDPDCTGLIYYYNDSDQDGYGVDGDTRQRCAPESPYTATSAGDCDDANENINPGIQEICNGIDDDCDMLVDAEDPDTIEAGTYYRDDDDDGYGVDGDMQRLCAPQAPYTALEAGDCDDENIQINPGSQEICNGADDDCDSRIDDDDDNCIGLSSYYKDEDEDGHGVEGELQQRCDPEYPYTALVGDDCDDTASTVYPGALETACDGIDQDCDGSDSCSCRIIAENAAVSGGNLVRVPVRLETACNIVDAFSFDFDYSECHLLGYLSFTGNYTRGDLTANWDYIDAWEVSAGVVRVAGLTLNDIILEGERGVLVELEFELLQCTPDDTCSNALTNLASDINGWGVVPGTFECDCPSDGDVNGDGQATPGDALLAFQHYLGTVQLTPCEAEHADVDGDALVSLSDSLCIFQCYMGNPCPELCP